MCGLVCAAFRGIRGRKSLCDTQPWKDKKVRDSIAYVALVLPI